MKLASNVTLALVFAGYWGLLSGTARAADVDVSPAVFGRNAEGATVTTAEYRPDRQPLTATLVRGYRYPPYRYHYRPYRSYRAYRPYAYPAYGYGYPYSIRSPYYFGYRYPGAYARGYYARPRFYFSYGW